MQRKDVLWLWKTQMFVDPLRGRNFFNFPLNLPLVLSYWFVGYSMKSMLELNLLLRYIRGLNLRPFYRPSRDRKKHTARQLKRPHKVNLEKMSLNYEQPTNTRFELKLISFINNTHCNNSLAWFIFHTIFGHAEASFIIRVTSIVNWISLLEKYFTMKLIRN